VKNVVKEVRATTGDTANDQIASMLDAAKSTIDKAAKKGVIHKRTAGRKISRLSKLVNSAS
jgi:small subunit ribosomal protein S20